MTTPSKTRPRFARAAFLLSASAMALPAFAADETFAAKAAGGGLAEVEAGKLAQQKGTSDGTRQYGAKIVEDHSKANDELRQIATAKSMTLPSEPDAAHQKAKASLESKSGPAFDHAFKAQMVTDHKATIALFEKEAKSGSDPELKAYAGKTLPDLQEHLKMAQALK